MRYLRPLSFFSSYCMLLCHLKGIWHDELKLKTGFCICMAESAIGRVPMRTWRVVQNGILVWNVLYVFWFFQLIRRMVKLRPHRWPKSTCEKGWTDFPWFSSQQKSHQQSTFPLKKGGKISCWKISNVFFFPVHNSVSGIPTNATKRCVFFFAEAWNSADLLMMKAGKNFIAWRSFVWKFLCWTFLFLKSLT